MRPWAKKPMSRAPESFCGARWVEEEVVLFAEALVGWARTVSRWWAMRVLSLRITKRENSDRTEICVTRLAAMA